MTNLNFTSILGEASMISIAVYLLQLRKLRLKEGKSKQYVQYHTARTWHRDTVCLAPEHSVSTMSLALFLDLGYIHQPNSPVLKLMF